MRQAERKIILPIIIHVLSTGRHEKSKDVFDETYNAWNYSVRGQIGFYKFSFQNAKNLIDRFRNVGLLFMLPPAYIIFFI